MEVQPARPAAAACTQPGSPRPPRQGGLRLAACRPRPPTWQPHLPAPARAPASAVPFPSRAAALGRLPDSSSLHALPDFKHKQTPPPRRGARRASSSPPPGAGKFAGRARAGRAGCHPSLAAQDPRRTPRRWCPPRDRSPSLRVTPSPAMQCQDCTAVTHRLSSQLEKKKRGREATEEEDSLACYKGLHNSALGARSPSGRPARAARRRAGTSSTTSSAQLSRVGLSRSRPGAAHFLRPNKAGEGVFKPSAACLGWGFPADLTSTPELVTTLPQPRPAPPMA